MGIKKNIRLGEMSRVAAEIIVNDPELITKRDHLWDQVTLKLIEITVTDWLQKNK
jgi:hypothetical protein